MASRGGGLERRGTVRGRYPSGTYVSNDPKIFKLNFRPFLVRKFSFNESSDANVCQTNVNCTRHFEFGAREEHLPPPRSRREKNHFCDIFLWSFPEGGGRGGQEGLLLDRALFRSPMIFFSLWQREI